MNSEVENYADFSKVRYAQCWEDADILLEGLQVQKGGTYLSIASAGDNALAILSKDPDKVVIIDLSPAQICCVELRKTAYKYLTYEEMIGFSGIYKANNRITTYQKLRQHLPSKVRGFWDKYQDGIEMGFYHYGKFERYFAIFRTKVLPMIHSDKTLRSLIEPKTLEQRKKFYDSKWDNYRWKMLFNLFFSKKFMGKYGREKSFFRYVDSPVATSILRRVKYALTVLEPNKNPYLHYIIYGEYDNELPYALRKENFEKIKRNIDNLQTMVVSIEDYLDMVDEHSIDGFNLSDIFEYMSEEAMLGIYQKIIKKAKSSARIAYWNMLAPRSCPKELSEYVRNNQPLSKKLFLKDKTFFYSAFHVDEIII